jgi:hypothetical protein
MIMNKFVKRGFTIYFWVSIVISVLAIIVNRVPALNTTILIGEIFFGSLLITLSLTSAISIYKSRWGNGVGNVIGGYLVALPIPFIIRRIFFPILFRFLGLIYLLLAIYVVFYLIFVAYHHAKNKQTSSDLNALIKKESSKKTHKKIT